MARNASWTLILAILWWFFNYRNVCLFSLSYRDRAALFHKFDEQEISNNCSEGIFVFHDSYDVSICGNAPPATLADSHFKIEYSTREKMK